jgi:hypothetical protein
MHSPQRLRLRALVGLAGALLVGMPALADGISPHVHRATKQGRWSIAPDKPNGSGVQLRYDVPARLSVGQTATVRLRFDRVSADGARVELKAPDSVTITLADGSDAASVALPRERETTIDLRVTPQADGMHYLDVFTTQGGRSSAQSVALKVGSASAAMKRNGQAQTTPSGEKIISLPAQR